MPCDDAMHCLHYPRGWTAELVGQAPHRLALPLASHVALRCPWALLSPSVLLLALQSLNALHLGPVACSPCDEEFSTSRHARAVSLTALAACGECCLPACLPAGPAGTVQRVLAPPQTGLTPCSAH